MKEFFEDIAFYALGIPIVLVMFLLWLVCKICGIRLEEDF